LFGIASALGFLFLALAVSRFVPDVRVHSKDADGHSAWSFRILPLVCALFFVYVGTETAFGNWAAMYARRIAPEHKSLATIAPAFFWGALLLGRALAPFVLKFHRSVIVARSGLAFGVLGGIALFVAHGMQLILAGCFLAGLGLSSIFPISVSLLPRWFGESARSVSGAVFGSGNVGGAVLPWVVGLVSTQSGDLRWGYLVPLAGAAFMLAFYAAQKDTKLELFSRA
jgi:FHS family L-fucose permease-like MFS transporter